MITVFRSFCSLLTIFVILFYHILFSAYWVEYMVHRDYYAKNICVQKNIKANTCQGGCAIKKKTRFYGSKDSQTPTHTQRNENIVVYILPKEILAPARSAFFLQWELFVADAFSLPQVGAKVLTPPPQS